MSSEAIHLVRAWREGAAGPGGAGGGRGDVRGGGALLARQVDRVVHLLLLLHHQLLEPQVQLLLLLLPGVGDDGVGEVAPDGDAVLPVPGVGLPVRQQQQAGGPARTDPGHHLGQTNIYGTFNGRTVWKDVADVGINRRTDLMIQKRKKEMVSNLLKSLW